MASLPLLTVPTPATATPRHTSSFVPILLAAAAALVGYTSTSAALSFLYSAAVHPVTKVIPQPIRAYPSHSSVLTSTSSVAEATPVPRTVTDVSQPSTTWPSPWVTVWAMMMGIGALLMGYRAAVAMFPLSGLRGAMEPFLDSIENQTLRHTAQRVTQDMLQAEKQGDMDRVLQCKTSLAGAMMSVSFEAFKKAARIQMACGTITVHSFVDTILVHAVPPLPSSDGIVHTSVLEVAEGRFWRDTLLWEAVPLLKILYDCEQEIQTDLCEVLMSLMCRYAGCVSYTILEERPDYFSEVEHKVLVYLAVHVFDTTVPYLH